jgi:PKD repeat protein
MVKQILVIFALLVFSFTKAQCPQIYNYLGVLSNKPYFINCTGGAYAVNFQSNSSWGAYTVNWGDLTTNTVGASYSSGTILTHNYASAIDTFVITLTIPANTCTMTGIVVMEKPVNASIQIPTLGITQACAPKTLTFTNASTDVSATTSFTWTFGDGTAPVVYSYTNGGQPVTHLYNKNTVNCNTQVTLLAKNYCSFGNPTTANFGPIQIFDVDNASINGHPLHCWPDNMFTFMNTTTRNCLPQGNTFQRQEKWNFGDYWGLGHDSIINWRPWPPSAPENISFPALGAYTVTLLDSNLCGVSVFKRIISIVNPPVSSVISPTGNICQNTSVTFTNASTPGPYQHKWNFGAGGGFVNLGSGNKTFTYTSSGTYTVKLVTFINGAGNACSDTSSAVITIQGAPVSNFTFTPGSGCGSLSVTYSDFSSNAAFWNWSFSNGGTSTLQTPPPQAYTNPGVHTTTLVVFASTSCTHSSVSSFTLKSKPLVAFSQFTACVGIPITFTNNSIVTGTNPITSYTWNLGDGSPNTNSITPVHSYSTQGSYTVKLKAETAFCSDSISQVVSINVKPTASFVATPTTGCPPFNVNFGNQSTNFVNTLWKFGPVATATTTGASYSFSNSTSANLTYTVTLVASTGSGCSDSVQSTINVRPRPVASFSANTLTGCAPLVTNFNNSSTGYLNSAWSFGDGSISTVTNPNHTYSNTSLFTQTVSARLVVTNSVGCSDSIKQVITIYPKAITSLTLMPASGCSPLNVNFLSIPGVASYTYDHGDGSPTYTTTTSHSWNYLNTSISNKVFTVSFSIQTTNGCFGSGTETFTVFNNPVAAFSLTPISGCSPLKVDFTNQSTGNTNNKWSFGNGQQSNSLHPSVNYTNSAGSSQQQYLAKLMVSSTNNCKDSLSQTVTILAQPKAAFTPDTPACTPKNMLFTNNSTGANSYVWNFADGSPLSFAEAPMHLFTNTSPLSTTFLVSLIARNVNNCIDSVKVPVVIHPKRKYFITSSPDSGCSALNVFFSKIPGVISYQWKKDDALFGTGSNFNERFENKSSLTKNYRITLITQDVNKCYDTATKVIKVYPVPTAKFMANPTTVYIPGNEVIFTNLSSGASNYVWDFGDGVTSKEGNPKHIYTKAGEYNVILLASSNKGCTDTFTLPEKVIAVEESSLAIPNAFKPNPSGSQGGFYNSEDKSNEIFYPRLKGAEKFQFTIYSRWGELLFETRNPEEGWDGYYRSMICNADIYIWKLNITFFDGRVLTKTGDVLLLR